jgi:SAM-dependent methyltransferase
MPARRSTALFLCLGMVACVSRYDNLLVTRTFFKAHRLAGFRMGCAILPAPLADDLNCHNEAYPLARPSQAAIATLQHEDKIRERVPTLRGWTRELAAALVELGARVFPSETYFFLADLRPFVPWKGHGLEIGVGTGRFAGPLGVPMGLDPSDAMLTRAAARGIETVKGTAEALPFPAGSFEYVLVVTTICFVDSPELMIAEAHRVLRPDGKLVIGLIDRESGLGQTYLEHRADSVFYREATFYSAAEVGELLRSGGFAARTWGQTLFHPLAEISDLEPVRPGTGKGA